MCVCVCVCVVTIGRTLKILVSNRETFLELCEIMAVPKVPSGCENWNFEFNENNRDILGGIIEVKA